MASNNTYLIPNPTLIISFFCIALSIPLLCFANLNQESNDADSTSSFINELAIENGSYTGKPRSASYNSPNYINPEIVYHENGNVCWKNPKVFNTVYSYNNSGIVYHDNGNVCWKDPKVYNTSTSYNNSGIVYYNNGKICWKDPKIYNTSTSYNNSGIVYYNNGNVCWKDPKVYNTSTIYNNSGIIYHSNGNVLWKDPAVYNNTWSTGNSGILYHSNGTICWKDPFIYQDGGKCFDYYGAFIPFRGLQGCIDIQLSEDCCVKIWNNGQFDLAITLKNQCYFVKNYNTDYFLTVDVGSSLFLFIPNLGAYNESIWLRDAFNSWVNLNSELQ